MIAEQPPRSLFKYYDRQTTTKVFLSKSIKFSSLKALNDPYEYGLPFRFPTERNAIKPILIECFELLEENPELDVKQRLGPLLNIMRSLGVKPSQSPNFDNAIDNTISDYPRIFEKFRDEVAKVILDHTVVFCTTSNPFSPLMWAHYAESFSGTVVELCPVPEQDSFLCAAERIIYQDDIPLVLNEEAFIRSAFGIDKFDYDQVALKLARRKSTHWSYEDEWRVVFFTGNEPTPGPFLRPLEKQEIRSVTFGHRMPQDEKTFLASLIRSKFPDCSLRCTTVNKDKYEISARAY